MRVLPFARAADAATAAVVAAARRNDQHEGEVEGNHDAGEGVGRCCRPLASTSSLRPLSSVGGGCEGVVSRPAPKQTPRVSR